MKKYKQKVIPETTIKDIPLDKYSQRKFVKDYYHEKFQGKVTVVNLDKGITIQFIGEGKKKTSYGSAMYTRKAAAIKVLDQLLTVAKYSNWGNKESDSVIGYLNFKVKVLIDGELCHFALNIQVRKDGKFHYSLDENRLQIKNPSK